MLELLLELPDVQLLLVTETATAGFVNIHHLPLFEIGLLLILRLDKCSSTCLQVLLELGEESLLMADLLLHHLPKCPVFHP